MGSALDNAARLGVLAIPVILGLVIARAGLISDLGAAIGSLNVFSLYVGFPALIAAGILDADFALPDDVAFWLAVPLLDLILVGCCWLAGRLFERQAGSMTLVCLFGNTAYLGIPFVVSVLGERSRGPAALLVAIQVVIAVAIGPWLLVRWSGHRAAPVSLGSILRQPLLWAPALGLGARLLPAGGRDVVSEAIGPLAASAAPVAMFLLGLYLFQKRELLARAERGVWAHVALRLLVAPAVSTALAVTLLRLDAIDHGTAGIVVIMGGVPAAITTFAMAQQAGVAVDRVAGVVVRSSIVSLFTLPVIASIAEAVARS